MVFIEPPIFTDNLQDTLTDEDYQKLQYLLIQHPHAGDVISGSGGLRKIRWRTSHSGKRGGVRVIYYWVVDQSVIYMLLMYQKTQQADIKPSRVQILRQLVEDYLNG